MSVEGDDSILEYKDSKHGFVRMEVPVFMSALTRDRIVKEVDFYMNQGRWTERLTLEILYHALSYGKDSDPDTDKSERSPRGLEGAANWLNESILVCEWEGITCGAKTATTPYRINRKLGKSVNHSENPISSSGGGVADSAVTKIDLSKRRLDGTLPWELFMLTQLSFLDLHSNSLQGTIPTQFGLVSSLSYLDLTNNRLTGTLPWQLHHVSENLRELWLGNNKLEGPISYHLTNLSNLRFLDISHNSLSGTIPPEIRRMKSLEGIFLESNHLTGSLITEFESLSNLMFLNLSDNKLSGPIPSELEHVTRLALLNLRSNRLAGKIPTELFSLPDLESLDVGWNSLTGTIPEGDDLLKRGNYLDGFQWSKVKKLTSLSLEQNRFRGTLPPALLVGISSSLQQFDIGFNRLTGTISYHIGHMRHLRKLSMPANDFTGTIPTELAFLTHLKEVNLTGNRFVGEIPWGLCDYSKTDSFLIREYGCDALLCPPGTFHPNGGASAIAGCRYCPNTRRGERMEPPKSQLLGRTKCPGVVFVQGDVNADGVLSPREILRMLYFYTNGLNWGERYLPWHDLDVHECELTGITCVGQEIARIDLSDAALCGNGNGNGNGNSNKRSLDQCAGLPAELGLLSSLEVLSMPRRQHLRGTIPTEFGKLTKLRFLDLSNCFQLSGAIPSELGKLLNLNVLNLSGCRLNSTIPSEIFELTQLEKLNLSINPLSGTIPSQLGNLENIRELMLSRLSNLKGPIPSSIGKLVVLENLEIYGNHISGTIPSEIGDARSLKRIDAFNNELMGTIPVSLANIDVLQIIHLKKNRLTGTIPHALGTLQDLIWFDASANIISGSIPTSFGLSRSLKDLRLGGNRLHDPIPQLLCENKIINGGRTRQWGCDAILCPLGFIEDTGFAVAASGCKPCPESETTMYLGGMSCTTLKLEDFLTVFYDVMRGDEWEVGERTNWKDEGIDVCNWEGIECEPDGRILEISFPVSEADL